MRPGVDFPLTVLSVGMLADICAPLLLVDNLDLLIAIDLVDAAYLQPWYEPCGVPKTKEYIQRFIRHILLHGSDVDLQCRACLLKKTSVDWPNVIRSLPAKCTIVKEEENGDTWMLDFSYRGKIRRLIYYFNRDYVTEPWPKEASRLSALVTVGSPFPVASDSRLCALVRERCLSDCTVFASRVVLDDLSEGWNLSRDSASVTQAWNRGHERINVHSFPLSFFLMHRCRSCSKEASSQCSRCHKVVYCSVVQLTQFKSREINSN